MYKSFCLCVEIVGAMLASQRLVASFYDRVIMDVNAVGLLYSFQQKNFKLVKTIDLC